MTPDEIQVVFAREDEGRRPGEPAWALVLLKGHRPALIHRSPYFRDVGFRWLFDPDPKYGAVPKLMGPIELEVPHPDAEALRVFSPVLEWQVEEGADVARGEALLTIEVDVPIRQLVPRFLESAQPKLDKALDALSGVFVRPPSRVRLPVFSGASGVLRTREVAEAAETEEPVGVVEVFGNRRHHYERRNEVLADPMAEYFQLLTELTEQQRAFEAERREEDAAKEARRKQEEEERASALEAQEARRREERRAAEKAALARAALRKKKDARLEYQQLSKVVSDKACGDYWWSSWQSVMFVLGALSVPMYLGLHAAFCGDYWWALLFAAPVLLVATTALKDGEPLMLLVFVPLGLGAPFVVPSRYLRLAFWNIVVDEGERKPFIDARIRKMGRGDLVDGLA